MLKSKNILDYLQACKDCSVNPFQDRFVSNSVTAIFGSLNAFYSMFDYGQNTDQSGLSGRITVTGRGEKTLGANQQLGDKEFKKWMKAVGKANNIKYSKQQLENGLNFYSKAKSGTDVNVLVVDNNTMIDNGSLDVATGNNSNTRLKFPSEFITLYQTFQAIEIANSSTDAQNNTVYTPQDISRIQNAKQNYLNNVTNNTGALNSGNSIIVDRNHVNANALLINFLIQD